MPSDAADTGGVVPAEWDRLELAVRRLLEDNDALRRQIASAGDRLRETEQALKNVSVGELDPMALAERARLLEEENRDLSDRLARARESVQRILARLRFAEEES